MKAKKENVIGTRVSDKLLKDLNDYAKKNNIKLSKLIREALLYYNIFVIEQEKIEVPIYISSKNEHAAILESLDRKELEKLAEVCFNNTMRSVKYHRDSLNLNETVQREKLAIPLRNFLKAVKERVLSKTRQNWFENLVIKIEKNSVLLAGQHNINEQFSLFLKLYFLKIMELYGYDLNKEVLKDKKMILQFQKALL